MLISADRLQRIVESLFGAVGADAREARLIATHLVEANLRGHDSHGVGMIPAYLDAIGGGKLRFGVGARIALDLGGLVLIDGSGGAGQIMAFEAMEIAIARAKQFGACVSGLRDSNHVGRIGHWAEQCAAAGLVSIHFVNVPFSPMVAPFGGGAARLGTNPFAAGFPRGDEPPIVVDFATSRWAVGKVRVALNTGKATPPGVLIDPSGAPTLDPAALFADPRGALLPMGEHKGYALSVACELLAGALTGGHAQDGGGEHAAVNSMFSVVVSPDKLGTQAHLFERIAALETWLRSAGSVLLPGEPERASRARRLAEGIDVDAATWSQIGASAAALGVSLAAIEAGANDA